MKPLTDKSKQEIAQFLQLITGWFAQNPAEIKILEGTNSSIVEIHPHPDDVGALIGRHGCVAKSLRLLFSAYGSRIAHELHPQIIEPANRQESPDRQDRRLRRRRNGG